jgi:DNA repair protein RecO (recombination protein O)
MRAIILKKTQFAETNEVVAFYSREKGKMRAMARATKSAKSKLAFGLQSLFLTELELVEGRGNAPTITGVKVLDAHAGLRGSSEKIATVFIATELILKATADEQPNEKLFDLFSDFLSYVSTTEFAGDKIKSIWRFIFDLLSLIGFKAQLDECVICGKKIAGETKLNFSSKLGGVVCSDCFDKIAAVDTVPISESARVTLNSTQLSNIAVFEYVDKGSATDKELRILAENFVNYILERDLKAPKFLV